MKKIILFLFLPLTILSQEKIETFEIFGKEYSVDATEPNSKGYTLYLNGHPLDKSVSQGGIMIKSEQTADFRNAWEKAKSKYIEWTATAKENDVTDLKKDIKVNVPNVEGFFSYGDWQFDWNVSPFFKYIISKEKSGGVSYGLILYTGQLISSSNKYIDSESFVYAFYSLKDIENFISLLDPKIVLDHFGEKNSKEDLFKD
tara:strand:- start:2976 stop:3578 length:603 start_codon:yes stop_codon:yes gene_type:complete